MPGIQDVGSVNRMPDIQDFTVRERFVDIKRPFESRGEFQKHQGFRVPISWNNFGILTPKKSISIATIGI